MAKVATLSHVVRNVFNTLAIGSFVDFVYHIWVPIWVALYLNLLKEYGILE